MSLGHDLLLYVGFQDEVGDHYDNWGHDGEHAGWLGERHVEDRVRVVEDQIQTCENEELDDDYEGYCQICCDVKSLFLGIAQPEVFPIDVVGVVGWSYLKVIAIVLESLWVSLVGLEEEVFIVLVLERNKGMTNEVGKVE